MKGTVPDSLNGKEVYLYAREIKDKKIATTVVENGRFEFTDTLEKPVVAKVKFDNEYIRNCNCVLDEVPVVMNFDGKEFSVTGSRRTDAMKEYDAIRLEKQRNSRPSKMSQLLALAYMGKKLPQMTEEDLRKEKEIRANNEKVSAIYTQKLTDLMKRNIDNVAGAFIFDWFYDGSGIDEDIVLQDSILAVAGKEFLETPAVQRTLIGHRQRIGQTYTDFELPDVDGKMHRLSDIVGEGKYVLVDVWASWCMGCRVETPHVKEAYAKYHDRGFEVVMVSIDADRPDWLKAMEKDGVKEVGYQLVDASSTIRELYAIPSIPCSMLIDPQGKIIAHDLRNDDLENHLSKVIGE